MTDEMQDTSSPKSPEFVLNPLAIYRMARKDINLKDGETTSAREADAPPTPQIGPINPEEHRPLSLEPISFDGLLTMQLPTSLDGLHAYMDLSNSTPNYYDLCFEYNFGNRPSTDGNDAGIW